MSGLYFIALKRLNKLDKSKEGVIRFPKVFEKLCCTFMIKKKECWEMLLMFRDLGFVEIVPFQGIKIRTNYKI